MLASLTNMKQIFFLFLVVALVGACSTKKIVEAKPTVKLPKPMLTKTDSISYVFGLSVAQSVQKIEEDSDGEIKLDIDLFSEAIKEKLADKPRMTDEEMNTIMQDFGREMQAKQRAKAERDALKSKEEGMQFLAANAKKDGVQTTASGLQYKILKAGTGVSPAAEDEVRVHYTGRLIDGSVFDSSVERGEPINFKLNQVIPGWTEGVQLMKKGAKYEFTIPSELGYGERGTSGIPGGSVLIFEVELLDVIK